MQDKEKERKRKRKKETKHGEIAQSKHDHVY